MSRKAYDRAEVVATAMAVFWQHGYHATSVQMLCDATGLNRKSLYAEFGSKDQLFEDALELYIGGGLFQSRSVLEREPLGLQNVRDYFGGMRYEDPCRGCMMTMTANQRGVAPEPAVGRVRDAVQEIEQMLRANLCAGGYPAEDSERVSTFLVFCIQGITTMGKLEGDNTRLRAMLDVVLDTLAAPNGEGVA